jgi:hypothetical protein
VHRRIERRLRINRLQTLDEYCRLLERSSTELGTLYKDLLIGVTSFFRDTRSVKEGPHAPVCLWIDGGARIVVTVRYVVCPLCTPPAWGAQPDREPPAHDEKIGDPRRRPGGGSGWRARAGGATVRTFV